MAVVHRSVLLAFRDVTARKADLVEDLLREAKPLIDVFIYRFGDLAGVGIERALATLGAGLTAVAVAAVPLAAAWAALALALGRAQQRFDRGEIVAR